MRLGFGTEAPNASVSVTSLESEFIIDVEDVSTRIGTFTTDDLHIVTDNTTRITVTSNGNIAIGDESSRTKINGKLGVNVNNMASDVDLEVRGGVKFDNKKFTTGDSVPTSGSYKKGDIVWSNDPKPTGYIGWVCIKEGTPGEWKSFGIIAS